MPVEERSTQTARGDHVEIKAENDPPNLTHHHHTREEADKAGQEAPHATADTGDRTHNHSQNDSRRSEKHVIVARTLRRKTLPRLRPLGKHRNPLALNETLPRPIRILADRPATKLRVTAHADNQPLNIANRIANGTGVLIENTSNHLTTICRWPSPTTKPTARRSETT